MAIDLRSLFSDNYFTRPQVEKLRRLYNDLRDSITGLLDIELIAGTGLTGGGDLTADRTFALDLTFTDARYPVLTGGKVDQSVLPAIAITDTFVVASQAAMLALTAQTGDVAIRTDLNKSFILAADPATTLANWKELLTPTDSVTSVFGRTGVVTAQTGDYTFAQIGSLPTTVQGYGITNALRNDQSNILPAALTDWRILAGSSVGADVLALRLQSGGAFSTTRGAILELNGVNAAANAGGFRLLGAGASQINAGADLTINGTVVIDSTGATTFGFDVTFNGGGACAKFHNNGSNLVFTEFYRDSANPTVRSAWFGYGSAGTLDLSLINEIVGGRTVIQGNVAAVLRCGGVDGLQVNASGVARIGGPDDGSGTVGTLGGLYINRDGNVPYIALQQTTGGVTTNLAQIRGLVGGGVRIAGGSSTPVWFDVDVNGRLFGPLIHNNASGASGTNPMLASGTYTPTLTNGTNVAASTSADCQWSRVGNVVTVSGVITVDPTNAADAFTTLGISLPIASAMTIAADLGGSGCFSFNAPVNISADFTNDRATLAFAASTTSSATLSFTFSYLVK